MPFSTVRIMFRDQKPPHSERDVTSRMYAYGALSECCTILRGLSVEWHS
jgi:hypothetical protein